MLFCLLLLTALAVHFRVVQRTPHRERPRPLHSMASTSLAMPSRNFPEMSASSAPCSSSACWCSMSSTAVGSVQKCIRPRPLCCSPEAPRGVCMCLMTSEKPTAGSDTTQMKRQRYLFAWPQMPGSKCLALHPPFPPTPACLGLACSSQCCVAICSWLSIAHGCITRQSQQCTRDHEQACCLGVIKDYYDED